MIDHLLDDGASVYRRPKNLVGGGRVTELPPALLTFKPFRSPYPAGASDRINAAREEAVVTHITYTQAATNVRKGDELVFKKQPSRRFLVTATERPSVPDHHLKVALEELQRDSDA